VEGTPEGAQLLGEKTITMAAEQITVADDPRRQELMKIAGEHKELVVQIIRSWLKEEKQRLKGEMGARAAEG
jgi:flagellar biosynthesis/type III secretory pathway M-ring protein FliF/YscJ